jgi:hypothetical protein
VEYVLIIHDSTSRKHVEHGEQVAKPEVGQAVQPYTSTMRNLKESTGDALTQNHNDVPHHDEDTRAQLMEQQAESVRYLNELNTVRGNYILDIWLLC